MTMTTCDNDYVYQSACGILCQSHCRFPAETEEGTPAENCLGTVTGTSIIMSSDETYFLCIRGTARRSWKNCAEHIKFRIRVSSNFLYERLSIQETV